MSCGRGIVSVLSPTAAFGALLQNKTWCIFTAAAQVQDLFEVLCLVRIVYHPETFNRTIISCRNQQNREGKKRSSLLKCFNHWWKDLGTKKTPTLWLGILKELLVASGVLPLVGQKMLVVFSEQFQSLNLFYEKCQNISMQRK